MKFLRSILTLLTGMMLIVGAAYAQEDTSIMERLNLTAQQKDQVKALREQFQTETKKLRADIKSLLEDEKRLKGAASPNEAALRTLLKQRADKEIELSLALTRFNEKLESILTGEQKQILKKALEERKKK
jgi:Spy/CpxP family protein refolding chaperone